MTALAKGGAGTRALLAAVVIMGVAIVAGVAFLGLTIVRRMNPSSAQPAPLLHDLTHDLALPQPGGSRIVTITATADRIAVLIHGGGPDRIILLDPRTAQVVAHVTLQAGEP